MTPGHDDHLCPECRAGKHRNCDGTTWCDALDRTVDCECTHEVNTP